MKDSKQYEWFKLARGGEKYLVFPLLQISSSVCVLSIAKLWEPNLPSHSSPCKHQFWSYGNCTAAALWSLVIFLNATGHHKYHFRLQILSMDPVRAAKGPQGTSFHITMAWQLICLWPQGHRQSPQWTGACKATWQNLLAQCNPKKQTKGGSSFLLDILQKQITCPHHFLSGAGVKYQRVIQNTFGYTWARRAQGSISNRP